ncbi:heterokaryon incompatibility protein-domain-containing protein [Aspergillus pseudonomiae]|uniref:Heterokaryon incompatibility protein-domain-containing protein n=1 Tax=Aspergillus pseudonomiae TaxID=1506151 RepID=A0A5N6HM93_9EURO|nr:heterokaryon incompatibility protein-domain-containing protein [Aspergillus pseudonomiae]KAB8254964.1 heterokaryon incompatibility protein-domain-containing protein [Aspergillus pseudonomiae]KAE8409400.1 heterokaryon incompatibility protein-domain-containing protein [Aspergillus pseudonomiae]
MSQYAYSRLPPGSETIRILRLLPSEDNTTQIQCQLVNYTLPSTSTGYHPYEALSYVWGSESTPQSIRIDGQILSVTKNLYTALLYLREHQLERLLWIDAICINQGDEEEKSQQIQFMPTIYGQANHVIVWLGETADQSDKALEVIRLAGDDDTHSGWRRIMEEEIRRQITRPKGYIPDQGIPTLHDEIYSAVERLLERPWFRRIWVLQEVHAARSILVMCGHDKINGYSFWLGLSLFRLYMDKPNLRSLVGSITHLLRGSIFRSEYTTRPRGTLTLGELIDMYHTRAATKKHDKVYALLGMSSDTPLVPDYKLPWDSVFQQVITYTFSGKGSVQIWPHCDLALIRTRGYILGEVSRVKSDTDRYDRQQVYIENFALRANSWAYLSWVLGIPRDWTLHVSAKPVQKGDMVCLLEGASKPSIVRFYNGYLIFIIVHVTPLHEWDYEIKNWHEAFETLRSKNSPIRDMSLIWEWAYSGNLDG